MFILTPVLLGIAAVGYPLVEIVLGQKWLPCVPYLQILCVGCLFNPLTHINLNLLYVKGRSDLVLKLELIKKPIGFLILFASIPFGIWWMCFGAALYNFIAFVFNCYYTKKLLNYGFFMQMRELANIFIGGIIMWLVVTAVMMPFSDVNLQLLIGILGGVLSYTLYAIITREQSYKEIKEIITKKVKNGHK